MVTFTFLVYAVACLSVTVLPGPTMLLAMSNGTSGQWRIVVAGILGAALSDLLLISAVALGLGTALMASETLFRTVKWVGVVYLCWLAFDLWRSRPAKLVLTNQNVTKETRAAMGRAFRRSLFVALSNPKGILFFTAFLPQFIDTTLPQAPQYIVLAASTAALDVLVMVCYAAGGAHAIQVLTAPGLRRLNRGCAAVLGSFAALLAFYNRAVG